MINQDVHNQTISVHQEVCPNIPLDELFYQFSDWQGQRYIFVNKDNSEWLFGAGIYTQFKHEVTAPERVSAQFRQLLSRTEVTGMKGNMIRLFGGFQFDAGVSAEFRDFGHSHFIWPKVQILYQDGVSTLTMTNLTPAEQQRVRSLLTSVPLPEQKIEVEQAVDMDAERFTTNVNRAVEAMTEGVFDKVVLARKKHLKFTHPVDTATLVTRAIRSEESSYFVLFEHGQETYISRTPEQLVKVKDKQLQTNAIAGTMARHQKQQLLTDEKNLKEHQIVVDSIYDDLKSLLADLTIGETTLLENEYFYHLYTPISGTAIQTDVLALSCALHPTPALGGYPKKEAGAFIQQMEGNRGFYGAPIGYVDADFDGEFIVAIRSMMLHEDEAILYAGCGVVKESSAEAELAETEMKFKPMLQLLGVTS